MRLITPLVLLLPLGCSDGSIKDTGDARLHEIIEYYDVTAEISWTGGGETNHMVARRTLRPSESIIHEVFIELSEDTSYEVIANVDVDANTFTMAYTDGTYEGTGELFGEDWDWHAWKSTSHATDGTYVMSEDTKDEHGIVANKIGYDADGQEIWSIEEILTPITEAEWLALQEDSE